MQEMQVEKININELFEKTDKASREPHVLDVVLYPNPILKQVSKLVTTAIPQDRDLQELLRDMECTLNHYRAWGLAAVQVGVALRVLVVRDHYNGKVAKVINPIVRVTGKDTSYTKEGCLSIPGVHTSILRPSAIQVEYFNELGEKVTLDTNKMMARAIQHEVDHLDGITFFDRMNSVQRNSMLTKFKRIKRKM